MKYTGTFNGKEGMKVARDEEAAQIFEKPLVTVTIQPPLERLRMFLRAYKQSSNAARLLSGSQCVQRPQEQAE